MCLRLQTTCLTPPFAFANPRSGTSLGETTCWLSPQPPQKKLETIKVPLKQASAPLKKTNKNKGPPKGGGVVQTHFAADLHFALQEDGGGSPQRRGGSPQSGGHGDEIRSGRNPVHQKISPL